MVAGHGRRQTVFAPARAPLACEQVVAVLVAIADEQLRLGDILRYQRKADRYVTCLNGGRLGCHAQLLLQGCRPRMFHSAAQLLRRRALPEQAPGSANRAASCRARLMPCNMIAAQSRASKPLKKQRECHHAAQRCTCPPSAQHISSPATAACWHRGSPRQGIPLARWRRTRPQPSARAGCGRPSHAAAPASPPLQPPVRGTRIRVHLQPSCQQVMVAVAGRSFSNHIKSHRPLSAHRTDLQCCGDVPGSGFAAADGRVPRLDQQSTPGQHVLKQHMQLLCNMQRD